MSCFDLLKKIELRFADGINILGRGSSFFHLSYSHFIVAQRSYLNLIEIIETEFELNFSCKIEILACLVIRILQCGYERKEQSR